MPLPQKVAATGGILRKGTPLRLVTNADITSDAAQAGDPMPLLLDENVMDGDTIIVPKGTAVEAVFTRVTPAGAGGRAGVLAFQVNALRTVSIAIPLEAKRTLAAPDPAAQAQHVADASLIHVAGALPRGEEAEIIPGLMLTAYVTADTALGHQP